MSDKPTNNLFDETVKRMLSMPPRPHKKKEAKAEKKDSSWASKQKPVTVKAED
ncbi:MAG: hypothetical protein ACR2KU_10110 [Gammaproteobacteria bacterium]